MPQSNDSPLELRLNEDIDSELRTDALAVAVSKLPPGKVGSIADVQHYPASSITDRFIDVHLTLEGNKIIIVVGCPESGPKLSRVVLWQGENFKLALQERYPNWEPSNDGITQRHIDQLAAFVQGLAKPTSEEASISTETTLRLTRGLASQTLMIQDKP